MVAVLAACAPALPETVVPNTEITLGWTAQATSLNSLASPTAANLDIAAMTRSDFGDLIDGEFVADPSFGTVEIVGNDPFTVRYDLAEPMWSDGIPLDAADLLLGWAGASGYFAPDGDGEDAEADAQADMGGELTVPTLDEFARAIDVTLAQPTRQWQQLVSAPVPAHVVGQRAFGTEDPMEAKQSVIRAIRADDTAALEKIAAVWNDDFEITQGGDAPADILLSSGPFQIEKISGGESGQSIRLAPNPSYRGIPTAQVARIDLVPPGDAPLDLVGDTLDILQVAPLAANRAPIRELERQDFTVDTGHDGTVWAVQLKPAGVFAAQPARVAFIHAVPASSLREAGGGEWASAYTGSISMVSAPGSEAYDIVGEDSGFTTTLGTKGDDPVLERLNAGVPDGSRVCVLYDRGSEFAVGAFSALRAAAGESGWNVVDCGSDDLDAAIAQSGWDAVIARVPIPQTADQIAAQWGTGGDAASFTGQADPARDALIAQLAITTDVYEARDLLAQIEATIVQAAVALPIAVNPRVTVIDRDVTGVATRDGAVAAVTSGVAQWAVVP